MCPCGSWRILLHVVLQLLVGTDAKARGLLLERDEEVGRLGHRLLRRLEVLVVGDLDLDQRAQVGRRLRQSERRLGTQPRQQRPCLAALAVGRVERAPG